MTLENFKENYGMNANNFSIFLILEDLMRYKERPMCASVSPKTLISKHNYT